MAEEISRQEALEHVRQCEYGVLIITDSEPLPAIGDVPDEDREREHTVSTFEFGETDLDVDLDP